MYTKCREYNNNYYWRTDSTVCVHKFSEFSIAGFEKVAPTGKELKNVKRKVGQDLLPTEKIKLYGKDHFKDQVTFWWDQKAARLIVNLFIHAMYSFPKSKYNTCGNESSGSA